MEVMYTMLRMITLPVVSTCTSWFQCALITEYVVQCLYNLLSSSLLSSVSALGRSPDELPNESPKARSCQEMASNASYGICASEARELLTILENGVQL